MQKVIIFLRSSVAKDSVKNDASLIDDLLQRANSTILEAQLMSHDAGVIATELFTHLHMLRRRTVLESPSVDLPQRDKDSLLVMSVGGIDLFGPNACKVQEWKWDTEEEKVKLISCVFEERERKSSASSWRPPRSLTHQSPLVTISTPRSKDSYQRPPGQPFQRDSHKQPSFKSWPSSSSKSLPVKTRNLPNLPSVQAAENKVLPTEIRTVKDFNSPTPSTKEGGVEGEISANRTDSLPVGEEASPLPGPLARTFPAVSGDNLENLSRHPDSFQRWGPDTSSSPSGVTQQQQASRPSSCEEAQGLQSHRGSEAQLVTGLLQPPLSGAQARSIFPSNHRPEEVKSISGIPSY